jgi:hypothetical protein
MLVVMAGVAVWFFISRRTPPAPSPAAPVETTVATEVSAPPSKPMTRQLYDPAAEPTDEGIAVKNEARPEAGTGENQLEHMVRSVIAANASELKLTPAEVNRLANDYLEYQEVHAELAMRFLQETGFSPGEVTLRLPAYPVEGKILRDMFYRRLSTDFPGGKAAEIQQHLAGFFDNAFRGFGVTEQSFTIKRNADLAEAFEVQWEAKAPVDQPSGTLNPDVSFAGSSGTMLLYREQVESGEFRFLGPVLERRFPNERGAGN